MQILTKATSFLTQRRAATREDFDAKAQGGFASTNLGH